MRPGRMLLVFAAVGALLTAACAREATLAAPVEIVAKDYAFEGVPDTLRGGAIKVSFRNAGKADHELAFLNIGDTPFEAFKKEFPKVLQGGPFPAFMKAGAVPVEIPPGKSATKTFTLPEGRYLLMCALDDKPGEQPEGQEQPGPPGKPHYELGMYKSVTVEGGTDEELTAANGEVVAKDYTFEATNLKPGRQQLVFRNDGPKEWHFAETLEFPAGITPQSAEAEFKKVLQLPEGQQPPPGTPEPQEAGFSGIFSPGLGGTFNVTFKAGRTYLFACFIQDLAGGPPHAVKYGMVKAFKVG